MERGLKSADPRDCTCYTGWAGRMGELQNVNVKQHVLNWMFKEWLEDIWSYYTAGIEEGKT